MRARAVLALALAGLALGGGSSGCASLAPPPAGVPPAEGSAAPGAPLHRPARLVAVSDEPREIPLRWQPLLRGPVEEYRIYRRDAASAGEAIPPFVEVGRVGAAATAFVDRGGAPDGRPGRLADGQTYVYVVAAVAGGRVGERSEPVAATTAPPPGPPEGLELLPPRAGEVVLAWEPSADHRVAGYEIQRSPFASGPFERVGVAWGRFAHTFADPLASGLARLRTYYYRVASVSVAGGVGLPSELVPAWLKPPPVAPLDVSAVGGLARHARIRWSLGHEHDLKEVVVWRAPGAETSPSFARIATLPAGRTEYTDAGLPDGATLRYRVTVVDADGLESEPSAPASATTRRRPEAPREVSAARDGDTVTVRWRPAPPAAGITRYRLVRIGLLGGAQPVVEVTGSMARDAGPSGGRYAVVAIDVEGLESLPSEPVAPAAGAGSPR